MELLWTSDATRTVSELHQLLTTERELAYTTVMTVLDRLAKKGIVLRRLEGRAWLYEPARSRLDLYTDTVDEALGGLSPAERTQVLRTLLEASVPAAQK